MKNENKEIVQKYSSILSGGMGRWLRMQTKCEEGILGVSEFPAKGVGVPVCGARLIA